MSSLIFLKEPVPHLAAGGLRGIFPGAAFESFGSTLEAAVKAFRNNS
jgi:hypothetical protein